MAVTGKRYTLIEGKSDAYFIKTQQIFHNTFPGISDDWLTALMSNLNLINCNAGDVVFKQGEDRKEKLFIILSGICSVVYHDGKKLTEIAKKETGDFIGEMAIIKNEEKRSASIVAKTPVILCEINDELFYSFLKSENRVESIIKMWGIRKELESCYPFSSFSNYINERIAYNAVRENYKKDQILNNETLKSNFFILLNGSISIIKKDKEIKEFKKGEVFGNIPKRKFKFDFDQFKFKETSTLLKFDSNNIFNIINDAPFFNYIINNYYE
jgi:signal-transduction protein with cAMP-binding, CBS, and nucleotidyltransferase domain